MSDMLWIINRLKAMSFPEMLWRISQKLRQTEEKRRFTKKTPITSRLYNLNLKVDAVRLHLNRENKYFSLHTVIPLLGGYDYKTYKKDWQAGFQTENQWPLSFSYDLNYRQRDDIGDARTNWELNRHFQFVLLAKNYYVSHDKKYLTELQELFEDWNRKNPFLWGISWTSVMEIAIRCSNWCYVLCFLEYADAPEFLRCQLQKGIINMTEYITRHYSRYSSANNHLIVEAYAIGQSGVLFHYQPWIDLALSLLTRELLRQNYPDGVNKEMSLHYQAFYMEAMGLMMRLLQKNGIPVPKTWKPMLEKMCTYIADCMGDYGETVVFGDNDEGKILDLCDISGGSEEQHYYKYILGMFSFLLDRSYLLPDKLECETLKWLFDEKDRKKLYQKKLYKKPDTACYRKGGISILRSKDRRILIGVDHAALGFGSIAAHGHADALSFQMYVDGQSIFVDPGTYIYHCDLESRNAFRRTQNHNTVCVGDRDQSEMLGAFLWGRKAECRLLQFDDFTDKITLIAEHNGYEPVIHQRKIVFDKDRCLEIADDLSDSCDFMLTFLLAPQAKTVIEKNIANIFLGKYVGKIELQSEAAFKVFLRDTMFSRRYGIQGKTQAICVRSYGRGITSKITVWEDRDENNICKRVK